MRHSVSSYYEDNLKPARPAEDDCGPPGHPIYGNFAGQLWRRHTARGPAQAPGRSRGNAAGRRPAQEERAPDK